MRRERKEILKKLEAIYDMEQADLELGGYNCADEIYACTARQSDPLELQLAQTYGFNDYELMCNVHQDRFNEGFFGVRR